MTGEFDQIAPAWVAALNTLEDVVKDRTADMGTYRYTFADLRSVLITARTVLSEHGLAVHQTAAADQLGSVSIVTTVWHTSGESITAPALLMPAQGDARQIGSAITYGRRYALMAFLGLATEDDDGQGSVEATQREMDEAAELARRVAQATADLRKLDDDGKAAMAAWKGDMHLSPTALHDEDWLLLVEAWLDERAAS